MTLLPVYAQDCLQPQPGRYTCEMNQATCAQCTTPFTITTDDLSFYEKIGVSTPTLCSQCRYIRRLLDRNEWTMYKRTCDATDKPIVSIYRPDAPFPVYNQEYWKSDAWDPTSYGKDFDFSRPFFEQYDELRRSVPHLALVNSNSVNSEYTNQANNNKDCYMHVTSDRCEKCMYGSWCQKCFMTGDCYMAEKCEFCFDSINITNCSNCAWLQDCADCVNVYLSSDCRGCTDCFGCVGLRNKQYHWFNKNIGKEEYRKRLADSQLSRTFLKEAAKQFTGLRLSLPVKYFHGVQAQESSGDYIENTQRARLAFNCRDNKDTAYMQDAWSQTEDCRDCTEIIVGELSYEIQGVEIPNRTIVARSCFNTITDSCYCDMCFGVSDCFGCFGLKKNQYCILNKQYTKGEYFALKAKIIEHMRQTKEWGEYFPGNVSPFAYNESMAQDYFPLTKEDAIAQGYTWYDRPESNYQITMPVDTIPATSEATDKNITEQIIECSTQTDVNQKKANPMCAKAFKITENELILYKKLGIPVPECCFTCRRKNRFSLRNPRTLWPRTCMNDGCSNQFETSYAPNRPEKVFCESCYQREVA